MSNAHHVWLTLTRLKVYSADGFFNEADPVEKITLDFEPGSLAEWELRTAGAMSWTGSYDVRGAGDGGEHHNAPIIHEKASVEFR